MNMEEEGLMMNKVEDDMTIDLPPGFRFHPTDEEIITHYLTEKVMNSSFTSTAIEEADFNKSEPWDLPKKATMGGEKERYYFSQRDRKYPTGMRTNRATESGYWKATGKDKEIYMKGKGSPNCLVGMKKTLVFYTGRAPKGEKTNWVMHEYRLDGKFSFPRNTPKDEWVVSRVFHKSTGIRKIPIIGGGGMMMNTIGDDEDDLLLDCPSSLPPLLDCPSNYYSSRPADCEGQFTAPSANKYGLSIPTSTGMINGHQNTYLLQASNNYNYPTNSLFQSQVPQLQNLAFPFKVEQQFPSSSSNQTMAVSLASQDTGLSTDMNTAEISSVAPMPDFSCLWDF